MLRHFHYGAKLCFCHNNLHPSASQTVDLQGAATLVNFSLVFKDIIGFLRGGGDSPNLP